MEPSSGAIIGGREVVVSMDFDTLASDVRTEAGGGGIISRLQLLLFLSAFHTSVQIKFCLMFV